MQLFKSAKQTVLSRLRAWPEASLLVASAFVLVLPILLLGTPGGDDFTFHQETWLEVAASRSVLPLWTQGSNFGYGDARFIYYPPLSWMLGGNLCRLLGPSVAPGAFDFLCGLIAGFGMYWLARDFLSQRLAAVAGAAYVLSPYFLYNMYWRSAFGEILAAALLPFALRSLLRLRQAANLRSVLCFALSLALIWLANIPLALIATSVLAATAALFAGLERNPRFLGSSLAGALIAVMLTAFYTVPVVVGQLWINPDRRSIRVDSVADYVMPARLIPIAAVLTVAALGLLVWIWRRQDAAGSLRWGALLLVVIPLVMMTPISLPLWRLPILRYMEIPFRWLSVFALLYAVAVACLFSRWRRAVTGIAAFGACAILCLPIFVHRSNVVPTFMADTQRSLENGEGYPARVPDWNPSQLHPDRLERSMPRAEFPAEDAGENGETCGSNAVRVVTWQPEHKVIEVNCGHNAALRLHIAYFPFWAVRVNGIGVRTSFDSAGVLEAVVPAGIRRVQVDLRIPGFLKMTRLFSCLVFAVCAGFLLKTRQPRSGASAVSNAAK